MQVRSSQVSRRLKNWVGRRGSPVLYCNFCTSRGKQHSQVGIPSSSLRSFMVHSPLLISVAMIEPPTFLPLTSTSSPALEFQLLIVHEPLGSHIDNITVTLIRHESHLQSIFHARHIFNFLHLAGFNHYGLSFPSILYGSAPGTPKDHAPTEKVDPGACDS